ncbi:hypothetical protein ACEPAG_2148 [Sanghuangporus baumii]
MRRFTPDEKKFLMPYMETYMAMEAHPHRDREIMDFKKRVAEEFIQKFDFTENLELERQRVMRKFSNVKKDRKPKMSKEANSHTDRPAVKTISEFFRSVQQRKVTARDVWLREIASTEHEEVQEHSESEEMYSKDGTKRGQHNKMKAELFASLPKDVRAKYEQKAEEENASNEKHARGILDDEAVARNIEHLSDVLKQFLTALPGRENPFSVGDALFTLNIAYVSPVDGKVHTDFCKKVWTKFASLVLQPSDHSSTDAENETVNDDTIRQSLVSSGSSTKDASLNDISPRDNGSDDLMAADSTAECASDLLHSPTTASCPQGGQVPSCDTNHEETDGLAFDQSSVCLALDSGLLVTSMTDTEAHSVHRNDESRDSVLEAPPKDEPRTLKRALDSSEPRMRHPVKRQKRSAVDVEITRKSSREIVRPARPDQGVPTPVKKPTRRRRRN